ncbi:COG1470 family protein [Paenarthrobacter histidinolovorans]|uniref:Uncharacterized protein n=1 Tax=Paenarthrobacter histidinolovorans TaxID=43664 RepID=A0ABW8NBV9_9MICC
MDHRPERTAPFVRGGVLRAILLALMVAILPIAALGAGNGQGSSAKTAAGITVALSPSSRTLDQGQSTTFTVSATSTGGFTGPVTFTISGLPAGATASVAPSSLNLTSGGTAQAVLTVGSATTTPAAKTDFTVKAGGGSIVSNTAPGQLQVLEVKRSFGVAGSVNGLLAPGVSRSVELQISNPGNKSIAVTNLSVSITQVVRTQAAIAANLPCTTADYKLTQYSGAYPLTVDPGVRTLSSLGVPESGWPRITMYDTPQLQDGCKGATLQLTYSGTGQGN